MTVVADTYNIDRFVVGLLIGTAFVLPFFIIPAVSPSMCRQSRTYRFRLASVSSRLLPAVVAAPLAAVLMSVCDHANPGIVIAVLIATIGTVATRSSSAPSRVESSLGLIGAATAAITIAIDSSTELSAALVGVLVAVTATAGLGTTKLDQAPSWTVSLLISITLGGIWLAAADTEAVLLVAGCLAPFLAVAAVNGRNGARLPAWPTAIVVSSLVVQGAQARPASIPGVLICWGVIFAIALMPTKLVFSKPSGLALGTGLVVIHAAAVTGASRWAARTADPRIGFARSVVVLTACVAALVVLARLRPKSRAGVNHPPGAQAHPPS